MTVQQLISILQGFDPELRVLIDAYEGGQTEVLTANVRQTTAALGACSFGETISGPGEMFGEHDVDTGTTPVVYIER